MKKITVLFGVLLVALFGTLDLKAEYSSHGGVIQTITLDVTNGTTSNIAIDFVADYQHPSSGTNVINVKDNLGQDVSAFYFINYSQITQQDQAVSIDADINYNFEEFTVYYLSFVNLDTQQEHFRLYFSVVGTSTHYNEDPAIVAKHNDVYTDAYNAGYDEGYSIASAQFYDLGQAEGYQQGFQDGLLYAGNEPDEGWDLSWVMSLLGLFVVIFGIELLPGFTIGLLVGIPLVFGLLFMFLKFIRG